MERFAAKCSVTEEGMNEGWVAYDGEMYFANEEDALDWCIENGYEDIQEAYDDGVIYWTDWYNDDEEDWAYVQLPTGEVVRADES